MTVVADVCHAFGLPPTRSRASRRHGLSGCYIAARALEREREAISKSAIVEAWTRYSSFSRRTPSFTRMDSIDQCLAPIVRYTLGVEQKYYDISPKLA